MPRRGAAIGRHGQSVTARLHLEFAPPRTEHEVIARLGRIDWAFRRFGPAVSALRLQGLHWYPGQFPEPLVTALLDCLPHGEGRFLDPFCGSGTAPFEAWTDGLTAVGSDSNAHAVRIARAKTLLMEIASVEVGETLIESYRARRPSPTGLAGDPAGACKEAAIHSEARTWFAPDALAAIAGTKLWIAAQDPHHRELLAVILSSVLRDASELHTLPHSFIADRSAPPADTTPPADLQSLFIAKIRWAMRRGVERRAETPPGVAPPEFHVGPATQPVSDPASVDLIVTSPPYYGVLDYTRSQYLSWLISPWDSYATDIRAEIGARRLRWSPKRLAEYLATMDSAFASVAALLRPGGYLALVIGQSQCSFVQAQDPLSTLRSMLAGHGLGEVWRCRRRIRFRKVNRTPAASEETWVLRR